MAVLSCPVICKSICSGIQKPEVDVLSSGQMMFQHILQTGDIVLPDHPEKMFMFGDGFLHTSAS